MTNRQHTTDNHQKASLNGSGLPIVHQGRCFMAVSVNKEEKMNRPQKNNQLYNQQACDQMGIPMADYTQDLEMYVDILEHELCTKSVTLPVKPDVTTSGDDDCAIEPVYATLHFYHDDPDSMKRMQVCLEAPDVLCSIDCFVRWLRNEIKYSQEQHPDLDRTWNMLFRCFEENNVKVPGWE